MNSNPHSDCYHGGLANRKMSLLASVCAQNIYIDINQYIYMYVKYQQRL